MGGSIKDFKVAPMGPPLIQFKNRNLVKKVEETFFKKSIHFTDISSGSFFKNNLV